MMEIKPIVEGTEAAETVTSETSYSHSQKRKAKQNETIPNKKNVPIKKPRLKANVEDQVGNVYFTSVEKLLDEVNYVKLISPLIPSGHSMQYSDVAIVIEAPRQLGMLPYMQQPVLF
jgi:translation initiation factor IF-3